MKTPAAEQFFSGPTLMLAQAIERGDAAEVDALARNVDLNKPGADDMTVLFFALQSAFGEKPVQLQIITQLVRAGADPLHRVEDLAAWVARGSVTSTSDPRGQVLPAKPLPPTAFTSPKRITR